MINRRQNVLSWQILHIDAFLENSSLWECADSWLDLSTFSVDVDAAEFTQLVWNVVRKFRRICTQKWFLGYICDFDWMIWKSMLADGLGLKNDVLVLQLIIKLFENWSRHVSRRRLIWFTRWSLKVLHLSTTCSEYRKAFFLVLTNFFFPD